MSDDKLSFDPIPVPRAADLLNARFPSTPLPPLADAPPTVASLLPPPPLPRPEPKPTPLPELPKLPEPVKEVAPPPVEPPPARPPMPSRTAWVAEVLRLLVTPTKQKAVIAAGIASLFGGAYAAKLVWPPPARVAPETAATVKARAAEPDPAPPLPEPPTSAGSIQPADTLPPVVAVELPPLHQPAAAEPHASDPLPPVAAPALPAGLPPPVTTPERVASQETPATLPKPKVEVEIDPPATVASAATDLPPPTGIVVPSLTEPIAGGTPAALPAPSRPPHSIELASNPPKPTKADADPLPAPTPAEPAKIDLPNPTVSPSEPTPAVTAPMPPEMLPIPSVVRPEETRPATPAKEPAVDKTAKSAEKQPTVKLTGVDAADDPKPAAPMGANEFKLDPPIPAGTPVGDATPVVPAPSPPAPDGFKAVPGATPNPPAPAVTAEPPAPMPLPTPVVETQPTAPPPPTPTTPADLPATMTKPAGDAAVPPVRTATSVEPITDFDVDLHEVRQGDSYRGISQKYLGDDRYADAIRAFNGNRDVTQLRKVQVPPIHVLRKRYPNLIGQPVSGGRSADRPVEWAPVGLRSGAAPADGGGYKTYPVPPGGITLKGVAKEAFGDEMQWQKVWELNPKYSPQEPIPAGTRLLLPADAKVGR